MILTNKQQEGLRIILERYRNHEKYTVISGYAGTGKSTLVKFAIAALSDYGIDPETDVAYATYTGKAAQVLINKGNLNATTLHKLLYDTRPLANGKFIHVPKDSLEYSIIVVDEASMAPKNLIDLLLSHHIYVIYLGDPFQLSPIDKDQDHGLLEYPHVFLDEIMRQAEDSEIIRLSMDIRAGKPLKAFQGNEVRVLNKREFEPEMLLWGDITLCAKNKTRDQLNTMHRGLLGLDPDKPCEGDRIINLRNDWDTISSSGNALTNGVIGTMTDIQESFITTPWKLRKELPQSFEILFGRYVSDTGDDFGVQIMSKEFICTGIDPFSARQKYLLRKEHIMPQEMIYGYSITCWKAQGSEFNKVVGIEENFPFDKQEHARYLYTLATRASQKLVLIKDN